VILFNTRDLGDTQSELVPRRAARGKGGKLSTVAMHNSVTWATMNLWAALESMMPADIYRYLPDGSKVQVSPTPFLQSPSSFAEGHPESLSDFLYARRMSLKGWGNYFAEITAVDAFGFPAQIQPLPPEDAKITVKNYRIVEYKFGRTVIEPRKMIHHRENLLPGNPVGMSPIGAALFADKLSYDALAFMAEWFSNGTFPGAHLKNVAKVLAPATPTKRGEAEVVKAKYRRDLENGDVFVTGSDWTYTPIQAKSAESGWLEVINATAVQICQYQNTPASMVDVATNGTASITYQNITQKNLDFLVTRMGPSLKRTDDDLTAWTPRPRYVRLTREAVLAMDPLLRAQLIKLQIDSRTRTPDEGRHIDDLAPLTEEQINQFDRLFGSKNQAPAPKGITA